MHRWGGLGTVMEKPAPQACCPHCRPFVHPLLPPSWQPAELSQAGGHGGSWQGWSPSGPPPALVKALLISNQVSQFLISGSSKNEGSPPLLIFGFPPDGMGCNGSSKNSTYRVDRAFPLRGLNTTSLLKVPPVPKSDCQSQGTAGNEEEGVLLPCLPVGS